MTQPERVRLKSGRRVTRPAPVSYRRQDERDYLRATKRALVDDLDRLIRRVQAAPLAEGQRLVSGGGFLEPSRDRVGYVDGVVRARAERMREATGRRWTSTMKGTLSDRRLRAGDEAVGRTLDQWQTRERQRMNRALGDARRRVQGVQATSKDELLKGLRHERGIAFRRARTITRSGVQEAAGEMNRARQAAAGIRTYIWQTAEDELVREEHAARNGVTRSWEDSPIPGEEANCRCVAIPNIKP